MTGRIKVGIIGFGRMGEFYVEDMLGSGRWDIKFICDRSPVSRGLAAVACPSAVIISDEDIIFNDPEIQVVGLFALADSRKSQIDKAIASGKHQGQDDRFRRIVVQYRTRRRTSGMDSVIGY